MNAAGGEAGDAPSAAFPWERALHAGLCRLRLAPADFWKLTPREFAAMTGAFAPRPVRLDRAGLNALMHAFPDRLG